MKVPQTEEVKSKNPATGKHRRSNLHSNTACCSKLKQKVLWLNIDLWKPVNVFIGGRLECVFSENHMFPFALFLASGSHPVGLWRRQHLQTRLEVVGEEVGNVPAACMIADLTRRLFVRGQIQK